MHGCPYEIHIRATKHFRLNSYSRSNAGSSGRSPLISGMSQDLEVNKVRAQNSDYGFSKGTHVASADRVCLG